MKSKIIFSIIIASMLLFTFTSCVQNNKKQTAQTDIDILTIGVMSSMDYLPLAVAQERGYFTENNLEVIIQKFYSANERDAALQSNNLDGTILDYTGGAIQVAGGIPLKFTSQCDGTFEMIVAPSSNITELAELKGKKIAISRNTVIDFCTDMALSLAGLSNNDAEMVEINKIPLRLEMLNNSKIDATMIPDPFATIAKSENNKAIISMDQMGIRVTGIAFHQKAIDEKSSALKKLYIAYNKAIEDLTKEPVSNFESLLVKEVRVPAGIVSNIVLPNYSKAQIPSESDLQSVDKWLKNKNLVPKNFDINSIVASEIIDEVK